MITFTIIERVEDAGHQTRVFLVRGTDPVAVLARAFDTYEEKIGEACDALGISGLDDRISEGAQVSGKWFSSTDVTDPWATQWVEEGANGYVEWKYRDGSTSHTISVYPPDQEPQIIEVT